MFTIRHSDDRGHFDHGWLKTWHSFSFGEYRDPDHMGYGALRVINQDIVQPGQGFGLHPHRDMEILTYVTSGVLQHRDSLGTGSLITPGEVQVMSAGRGVMHSEFNPSATEPVHLLQIWVLPARLGSEPRYDQRRFPELQTRGSLTLLASPDGRDSSLVWGQDVLLWAGRLADQHTIALPAGRGRRGWLQVVTGVLSGGDALLGPGDGAFGVAPELWSLRTADEAEVLFFDLP